MRSLKGIYEKNNIYLKASSNLMNLQVLLPQCVSMAEMDDMYDFAAFPIPKSAGIELECQTP
jgi:hypothetical protein